MFFEEFRNLSAVFADFPGLELPTGAFDAKLPDLAERIMASSAIREWAWRAVKADLERRDRPEPPRRDLPFYKDRRRPRSLSISKATICGLYGGPAQGDLVVVPGPIRTRRIMVGQFTDGPEIRKRVKIARYGSETIPARAVHWFPSINELELPERVSEVVRRPNPFVEFERTLYSNIFDHVFGSYVFAGHHSTKFHNAGEKFTGTDNFDFMILSEAIARLTEMSESKISRTDLKSLIAIIVGQNLSDTYKPDLAININSPGSLLFSSRSIVPLVLLAMMALTSAASGEPSAPEVRVVNSAAMPATDTCTPKVDESVRNILRLMSIDIWREACEKTARLRQEPKLNGPGHVTPAVTARP